jgi:CBS domain-containing protein
VFPFASHDVEAPRVRDLPIRRIPVIPAHLSMAAARRVAALRRIALLLVEAGEQIVGMVDQSILGAADDQTPVVTAMKPLGLHLRLAMSMADARDLFVRARTSVLPVIAGGFVFGAVERAVVERIRPRTNDR